MTLTDFLFNTIVEVLGGHSAMVFLNKIIEYNNAEMPNLDGLPDQEQIVIVNNIIRNWLLHYNDTLEIREWLTGAPDLKAYVYSFKHHWMLDMHKLGLLN